MDTYIYFLAGALILIVGIVVALRSYPTKRICGYIESHMATVTEDDVELASYNGEPVEYILHHQIYIWNGGNVAIGREDIVDGRLALIGLHSDIQVIFKGYGLVGPKFTASVEKSGDAYVVEADRLGKGQGLWIHLVELTSKRRKSGWLSLSADVLGVGDLITKVEARPLSTYLRLLLRPLRIWFLLLVLVIVLFSWNTDSSIRQVGLILAGSFVIVFWFDYLGFLKRLQASVRFRVPRGFDKVWGRYDSPSIPETARNLSL